MATETCADPSFGVHPTAQAVLLLLSARPPEFALPADRTKYDIAIKTYTWVNGREVGASLVVFPGWRPAGKCLVFAFGEDRKSDSLFVEEWEQAQEPFNGPTVENRRVALGDEATEQVYSNRTYFSEGDVRAVVNHIYTRMAAWHKKNQRSI